MTVSSLAFQRSCVCSGLRAYGGTSYTFGAPILLEAPASEPSLSRVRDSEAISMQVTAIADPPPGPLATSSGCQAVVARQRTGTG